MIIFSCQNTIEIEGLSHDFIGPERKGRGVQTLANQERMKRKAESWQIENHPPSPYPAPEDATGSPMTSVTLGGLEELTGRGFR